MDMDSTIAVGGRSKSIIICPDATAALRVGCPSLVVDGVELRSDRLAGDLEGPR